MGYTHYFPGLIATVDVIAGARKIIEASLLTVCGPKGQGSPILNDAEGIRLNGCEAAGEAHETFRLQATIEPSHPHMSTFCTTTGMPYDVVTAILIAAAVRALESPSSTICSDERWDNWAAGVALFKNAARPLTEDEKTALELDGEAMRPAHGSNPSGGLPDLQ